MSKKKKTVISVIVVILVLVIAAGAGMAIFSTGLLKKGNKEEYGLEAAKTVENSVLKDKNILFMGSSVTYGSAAKGVSFADYMEKIDGCNSIKEAVSGTTLVDNGKKSYVQRLKNNVDTNQKIDLLVCQLSTNDATKGVPLGTISEGVALEGFDTETVCGAIEYIIAYARQTWDCEVVFYTGPEYKSENYAAMVDALLQIQKKWDIGVIDQWNDAEFNAIDAETRKLYMNDSIHPTKAGYLNWWTPNMQQYLYDYMSKQEKDDIGSNNVK